MFFAQTFTKFNKKKNNKSWYKTFENFFIKIWEKSNIRKYHRIRKKNDNTIRIYVFLSFVKGGEKEKEM